MKQASIEFLGITPSSSFPCCPPHHPCTQLCETDKLCISCQKPDMETIQQIFAKVTVDSFEVICTPIGEKLVIEGQKHIKAVYETSENCPLMDTAEFTIPFCTFILLPNTCNDVMKVCTAVEYITASKLDCRCLTVSILIFACPVFKNEHTSCQEHSFEHNKNQTVCANCKAKSKCPPDHCSGNNNYYYSK